MNTPLVSILTTTYNREKYIDECIQSVLNSSYENWEMLIVDDQSSDRSVEIAKSYEEKDGRIKVYVNEKNLGDYPNRNQAASYAKGKYLKYLDADDMLYRYSLQHMVEIMEENPNVNLALSHNVNYPLKPYPHLINKHDALLGLYFGYNYIGVGPSEAIIRASAFFEIGGFSGKAYFGDIELWANLCLESDIVSLVPSLIYWRQHDEQQIADERKNSDIIKLRYQHKITFLEQLKDIFSPIEYIIAQKYTHYRFGRDVWNTFLKKRKPAIAMRLYKNSGLGVLKLFLSLFGIGYKA